MRLRELASAAAKTGNPLPPEFDRLYRRWFACGIPAFSAMLATFWLMLMKPSFDLL
jgi:uncharacterized membrane protein